jgi:histidinol-phosphate aminotransferase
MNAYSAPDPLELARPAIRALTAYDHAAWDPRLTRLHANESPLAAAGARDDVALNRYPEPQPAALVDALARTYGVPREQVLVGRGSDEGIDLLTRAFCEAGQDAVLVCPPTFGMYAVAARIQGAGVVNVPLVQAAGFALDAAALVEAVRPGVKLVYLCAPNNPTGNRLDPAAVDAVIAGCAGRALVVVDEAYVEYSAAGSLAQRVATEPCLVVLRTLSKSHGLAGARVGTLIADPRIVALLRKIIPPYALPQPTIDAALAALTPEGLAAMQERTGETLRERARVARGLLAATSVTRVWPSDANFLLVEFAHVDRAFDALCAAGLLVRDLRGKAGLERCLRITIGTPAQNDALLEAIP